MRIGKIIDKRIYECSGIAPSLSFDDHFWVHNDSGDSASVFLIHSRGDRKAELVLDGVTNIDFEDLSTFTIDNKNYIAVADIGDNVRRRKELLVHLIKEPTKSSLEKVMKVKPVSTIQFRFADGIKRDCEAIAVLGKSILLCSKLRGGEVLSGQSAEIFSVPFDLSKKVQNVIPTRIGKVPGGMITGMDVTTDGKQAVVRNYLYANLFKIDNSNLNKTFSASSAQRVALPFQTQGEAICFSKDGDAIIVASEGRGQDIWLVKYK